jgi:hypothetical protein
VKRFAELYGASPWHLAGVAGCLLVSGYAIARLASLPSFDSVAVWFAGSILGHDLVLFSLYSAAGVALVALTRSARLVNHVRVPAVLSGLLFLTWFPLILGLSEERFMNAAGRNTDVYLTRWVVVTGALFALSALVYVVRGARGR